MPKNEQTGKGTSASEKMADGRVATPRAMTRRAESGSSRTCWARRRYTLFSVVSAPVFLFVGHGVGQNAIPVFCLLWARALSCSKAGFLTEYAELGKMRSGAARTAGGWSHLREEVVDMPITITLHIFGYTVTIRIKGENRHSAK